MSCGTYRIIWTNANHERRNDKNQNLIKSHSPLISMKKTIWASIAIILISFILGIVLYSYMPQKMASHWNTQGEVNGYMPKFWGLFLVPLISIGLFLLLYFIPQLDPFKENVKKFRKHYDNFILITLIFLLYIHLLTLLWSLNFKFNMVIMLIPALAILF